jgi:hypothetical protein
MPNCEKTPDKTQAVNVSGTMKLVKKDSWEGKLGFEPPKFTSMVNV